MADKFEGQFPNYFSNVTRSVKYAAKDVVSEVSPSAAGFLDTNDEIVRIALDSLKNMPKAIRDLKAATAQLPGVKQARDAKSNLISDLKSGNFYNKNRISANESDSFGFDSEFADMFGDSVSSSMNSAVASAQSSFAQVQSQSTTSITSSMDNGFSVANSLISNGNAQNLKASEDTFNAINKLVSFNAEGMKPFMDRSLQYYDEQITESRKIVALLQEDMDHKRNMYKQQVLQNKETNFDKIFDADGFLDIKAYSKVVGQNAKDAFGSATGMDFDFIKQMLGANGPSEFITSPISAMMKVGMKQLIPTAVAQTSQMLDDTVKNFSAAMIAKINDMDTDDTEYGGDSRVGALTHFLKKNASRIFKVDPQKAVLDTRTYNKGPMPWNGLAQKSLIEVIPSLLSKINTGIHGLGEDLVYDYENSRFTTGSELKAEFDRRDRSEALSAMGGMDGIFEKYIQDGGITGELVEELRSGFDDLKFALAKSEGKYANTPQYWEKMSDRMSLEQYGGHDQEMVNRLRAILALDNKQAQSHIGKGQVDYVRNYNQMVNQQSAFAQSNGLSMNDTLDQAKGKFMTRQEYLDHRANMEKAGKLERLKAKLSIANSKLEKDPDKIDGLEAQIKEINYSSAAKRANPTSLLSDIKRLLIEGITVFDGGRAGNAKHKRKFMESQSKQMKIQNQALNEYESKINAEEEDFKNRRATEFLRQNQANAEAIAKRKEVGALTTLTDFDSAMGIGGAGDDSFSPELAAQRINSARENYLSAKESSGRKTDRTAKSVDREGTFLNKILSKPMDKLNEGMTKINDSLKDFLFGTGDESKPTIMEKGIKWLGKKWDSLVTGMTKFFQDQDNWLNRSKKKAQDWFSDKVANKFKTWWTKTDGANDKLKDFFFGDKKETGVFTRISNWGKDFTVGATNFMFGGNNSAYIDGEGKLRFSLKNTFNKDGVIGETFSSLRNIGTSMRDKIFGEKAKFDKKGKLKEFNLDPKFFPAAGKGAGIGLLASMFLPGGPLLGMLLGGAAGYAKRSGALGDFLFGKEGQEGKKLFGIQFNKGMRDEFKTNNGMGKFAGGAGIGMVASMFLPGGPLLGAAIGGFMGLVKSSETLREQLFGQDSKFAQVFGKDFKDKFGQKLPSIKAGLGIGALASIFLPGGPIIGALMGGVLGAVKDSKSFNRLLWGDKVSSRGILGGSVDFVKSKFLLPITKLFAKGGSKFSTFIQKRIVNRATFVMDVMLSDVKHYTKKLYSKTMNFFFNKTKGVVTSTLGKVFSPFLAFGKKLLGGAAKGIGKVISAPFAGAEAMANRRLKKIGKRDADEAARIAGRRAKMDEATTKSDTALQKVFTSLETYATDEQKRLKEQKEQFRQYHNIRVTIEKEINKATEAALKLNQEYIALKAEENELIKKRNEELKKYKGDREGEALVHSYHADAMKDVKQKQKNIEGKTKFDIANEMGKDFLDNDKDPMKFSKHGTKAKWYTFNENTVLDMEAGGTDAGHAILEGIVRGMEEARDQVDESVELHTDETIQKFRDEFGINSPAKELIPVGEGIIEGIIKGMKNRKDELMTHIKTEVTDPIKNAFKKNAPSGGGFTEGSNGSDNKIGKSFQDSVIEKEKEAQATALGSLAKHSEETAKNTRGLSLLKLGKKGFNALKAILFGAIPFFAKVVNFGKSVIKGGKVVVDFFKKVPKAWATVKGFLPKALKFGKTLLTLLRALPAAIAAKGFMGGIADTFGGKGKRGKRAADAQRTANRTANQNYRDMTPEQRRAQQQDRLNRGETIQQQNARLQAERAQAAGGKGKGFMKGLGKFGKGALGFGKGIPVLGQVLAGGMAAYDGFSGWNDAGKNFGLAEGQDATFGQKLSSAGGSILNGLSFGLLNEEKMAQGIHGIGSSIGDFASKATGVIKDALGGATSFVKDTVKGMGTMVSDAWGKTKDVAGDIAGGLKNAATKTIDGAKDFGKKTLDWLGFGGTEITSGYGMRISPFSGKKVFHPGTDIAMKLGDKVNPLTNGGTVSRVGKDKDLGKYIEIMDSNGVATRYGHLDKINVKQGQSVTKKDSLGTVGLTGKTTGPHLHFEASKNGQYINSDKLIKSGMGGSEVSLASTDPLAGLTNTTSSALAGMLRNISEMAAQISDLIPDVIDGAGNALLDSTGDTSGSTVSAKSRVSSTKSRMSRTNKSFKSKIKAGFKKVGKFFGFGGTEIGVGGPIEGVTMADFGGSGKVATSTSKFALPVVVGKGANRVTSSFGMRNIGAGPEMHKGVDYAPYDRAPGQKVMSIADGTVTMAKSISGYGNVIYVDHENGLQSRYAHLLNGGMLAKVGDKVTKGQIIGKMGSTGRSTGNHLHFEVRKGGNPMDPEKFLSSNGAIQVEGSEGSSTATGSIEGGATDNSDPLSSFLSETGNFLKAAIFGGTYTPGGQAAATSGDSSDGTGSIVSTTLKGNSTTEQVWNYFKDQGFRNGAIAGIMGNFQQESGIDPSKKQYGGGPGRGIMQWETGHGGNGGRGRWNHLEDWAKKSGRNPWDLHTQLDYVMKEMTGDAEDKYNASLLKRKYGGIDNLKKTADPKKAVEIFERSMERAGKPMWEKRFGYAQNWLNKYGSGVGGSELVGVGGPFNPVYKKQSVPQAKLVKPVLDTNIETRTNEMDTVMTAKELNGKSSFMNLSFDKILAMLSKIYDATSTIANDGVNVKNIEDARVDIPIPNTNQSIAAQSKPKQKTRPTGNNNDGRNIFLGSNHEAEKNVNSSFLNRIAEIATGKM